MLNDQTVTKLHEMKLSAMAEAFKRQQTDPSFNSMPFEDRFGLIVDTEWSRRKNNHLARLIRQADLHFSNAAIEDIEYMPTENWIMPRSRDSQPAITLRNSTTSLFWALLVLERHISHVLSAMPRAATSTRSNISGCRIF